MTPDKETELIRYWLKDNPAAIDLFNAYSRISQIWDDLYDGDKPVSKSQVNNMMMSALLEIPTNPFYQQHYLQLMPVVQHCLMTWLDANTMEKLGEERDLQVSYIIRSVTTELLVHMAGLVGGIEWRRKAGLIIRSTIYRDNEPFEQYYGEVMDRRKPEDKPDVQ